MMLKILIVDDEHMMLTLASRVLSKKYEVVTASDGDSAIELFDRENPDMLLTDLLMPGMTGSELRDELQKRSGRTIPTLFMTAVDDKTDLADDQFIDKPFSPDTLLEKVEAMLREGEAARKFTQVCAKANGAILMMKLVGKTAPEKETVDGFMKALRRALMPDDLLIKCGDIYKIFVYDMATDDAAEEFVKTLDDLVTDLSGGKNGIAAGIVFAPEHGTDADELTEFAGKCLSELEEKNRTGSLVFSPFDEQPAAKSGTADLQMLSQMFEEHSMIDSAFVIESDAFSYVYRFLLRYIQSYSSSAYKLLVTLSPLSDGFDEEPIAEVTDAFGDMVAHSLRKSDIMVRTNDNQYLIILPEITETDTERLVQRLLRKWETLEKSRFAEVTYEAEAIIAEKHQREHRRNVRATDNEEE